MGARLADSDGDDDMRTVECRGRWARLGDRCERSEELRSSDVGCWRGAQTFSVMWRDVVKDRIEACRRVGTVDGDDEEAALASGDEDAQEGGSVVDDGDEEAALASGDGDAKAWRRWSR